MTRENELAERLRGIAATTSSYLTDDEVAGLEEAAAALERGVWVPEEMVKFLLGEGDLDGVWFGEEKPGVIGRFWWRKQLRNAAAPVSYDEKLDVLAGRKRG
jgi:hypothetical protein